MIKYSLRTVYNPVGQDCYELYLEDLGSTQYMDVGILEADELGQIQDNLEDLIEEIKVVLDKNAIL